MSKPSCAHLGKQTLRPRRQHDQKRDVPGEDLPAGIKMRADRLRHAEDQSARERAPQAAEPADDYGLETEDQPRRALRWIEMARTARNTPAIATTANDSAIASAKTWRLSRPISCATAGSSAVARKARPIAVR